MEYTHQYSWIIPFIPFPVPINMLIGVELLLFRQQPNITTQLMTYWQCGDRSSNNMGHDTMETSFEEDMTI
ncbi:hypothetical protein JHK82_046749 [Glycine max]|uniref:NADH-plastoquinone oxidoreductase subunit 5 n=2 Tax=Glycine subgen. Soja TaxID=1462606 RepID=A0A0R0FIF1_SOYBN|nr:hypothetical protein JHK85_047201 [Glycine max]KAG5096895.1 hypothetical protein JHK82_046749 [Glycine max]KAG5101683.1 hypothetical protein JHK84_046652 [Glycine max]RZB55539.1 NAD(P)H-quinone oxidoreductase subunit 5, chloroplastic [Glycine soja]